jgi:hypothetical protein
MPRVSAADKLERKLIEDLERKCFDPSVPHYVQHRCAATLATMLRRRDHKLELKAAARAARRAAEPKPYFSVLPSNGREPPADWKPVAVKPFVIPAGINKG